MAARLVATEAAITTEPTNLARRRHRPHPAVPDEVVDQKRRP
jgi:hypothetical protein